MMKAFLIVLSLVVLTECRSPKALPRTVTERLQGHVTLVAGGTNFVVTKPAYRRFMAPKKSFPEDGGSYLRSQPKHKDDSSLDLEGQAVWVDVTGHVQDEEGWSDENFVATKVHHMGPAHPRYLAWRRVRGSGTNLPD